MKQRGLLISLENGNSNVHPDRRLIHQINMTKRLLHFCIMGLKSATILSHIDQLYETLLCSQFLAYTSVISNTLWSRTGNLFFKPMFLRKENDLCCGRIKSLLYLCKTFCVSVASQARWYSIRDLLQPLQRILASSMTRNASLSDVIRTADMFGKWSHS